MSAPIDSVPHPLPESVILSNGVTMARMGFGCAMVDDDQETVVHAALEAGFRPFRCSFYESWVDYQIPENMQGGADQMPGFTGIKRDRPTTYHKMHSLTRELDPVPPCPEPSDTWTDDRPYV